MVRNPVHFPSVEPCGGRGEAVADRILLMTSYFLSSIVGSNGLTFRFRYFLLIHNLRWISIDVAETVLHTKLVWNAMKLFGYFGRFWPIFERIASLLYTKRCRRRR